MPIVTFLMLALLFVQIKYTTNRLVSVLMSAVCAGTHTTSKPEHTMKYRTNKLAWSKKSWEMPSRSSFTCSLEGNCSFSFAVGGYGGRNGIVVLWEEDPVCKKAINDTVGCKLRRPTGQLQFFPLVTAAYFTLSVVFLEIVI